MTMSQNLQEWISTHYECLFLWQIFQMCQRLTTAERRGPGYEHTRTIRGAGRHRSENRRNSVDDYRPI